MTSRSPTIAAGASPDDRNQTIAPVRGLMSPSAARALCAAIHMDDVQDSRTPGTCRKSCNRPPPARPPRAGQR
eukprot:1655777-Lingulodinium_polyedra.AAC.1